MRSLSLSLSLSPYSMHKTEQHECPNYDSAALLVVGSLPHFAQICTRHDNKHARIMILHHGCEGPVVWGQTCSYHRFVAYYVHFFHFVSTCSMARRTPTSVHTLSQFC